jgi:hypothetical protein
MPLVSNGFDDLVVRRMLEFVAERTRWPRRLWTVGATLELREVLEASAAIAEQALTPASLRFLMSSVQRRLPHDPGFGNPQARNALKQLIPKDLPAHGHDWHVLDQATNVAEADYLTNWSAALAGQHSNRVEHTARSLAAHLLDSGASPEWTHRWLTYHADYNSAQVTLIDVIEDAAARLKRGRRTYKMLVTLDREPVWPEDMPDGWLTATEVQTWRATHLPSDAPPIRKYGGLELHVEALDPDAAGLDAAERTARIEARFRLGSRRRLYFSSDAWVAGRAKPVALSFGARAVEIHALERNDQLFQFSLTGGGVDAALELVEPLLDGPAAAALAGGWAALESLLVGPGDRGNNVAAADRMAYIVGCSFVRDELTRLAWQHQESGTDQLAADLSTAPDNRTRGSMFEAAMKAGHVAVLPEPTDSMAWQRMSKVINGGRQGMDDVIEPLRCALRRLYRQRNLVLHAGRTGGVAVQSTLRTNAPLVGAGLDRVVHVAAVRGMSALVLAAQAKLNVQSLGSPRATSLMDLLE